MFFFAFWKYYQWPKSFTFTCTDFIGSLSWQWQKTRREKTLEGGKKWSKTINYTSTFQAANHHFPFYWNSKSHPSHPFHFSHSSNSSHHISQHKTGLNLQTNEDGDTLSPRISQVNEVTWQSRCRETMQLSRTDSAHTPPLKSWTGGGEGLEGWDNRRLQCDHVVAVFVFSARLFQP